MTNSADSGPESFRDQFCRKYRCAPEFFERSVVRRCFPVLVRPLGAVLLTINPRLFQRELALVGRLGKAVNETGLRTELEATVALVFAQALPGDVAPSPDESRSYAQWLGQRPAADSDASA
jgi:hypothetical protein